MTGSLGWLGLLARLAVRSLAARRAAAILAALSVSLSVALLLSIEKTRSAARTSFAGTIADTDLIVGARTGGVQLMLYSVFRIGNATNNVTWESYEDIAAHPAVEWILPLSLGDSHRGFRVLGTTASYFDLYKYRGGQSLSFETGDRFTDLFDAVIGADVAAALGYKVGDEIIVSHGIGSAGLAEHDDKPFRISGVLAKSGTPVDRTVHVSLEAIEAIHVDWRGGVRIRGAEISAEEVRALDLSPRAITAAMVGLNSRLATFQFQRFVNEYPEEPLTAVLPGIALQELWSVVGVAETALAAVSMVVVAAAAFGMATMLLATLNERRREMAILRSVGAGPGAIAALLMAEALALTVAGLLGGVALHYAVLGLGGGWLDATYGLYLPMTALTGGQWTAIAAAAGFGALSGAVPAIRAYQMSLADGVSVRY